MSTEFLSEYSAKLFTNYAKLLLPIYLNIFTLYRSPSVIVNNFSVFLDVTSHFCLLSDFSALIISMG